MTVNGFVSDAPSLASMHGLLLFAHGARDPRWAEPFERVAARLRDRAPAMPLALAFLEFMQPDLQGAGDMLATRGCQTVTVLPLFLGTGGHVRKDLPLLLDALRTRHPTVQWHLAPAIGEHPSVVHAMADAALSALHPAGAGQPVGGARPPAEDVG